MEHLPMRPVFQAMLDAICTVVRSRLSLQLEGVALRHQLGVYQRSTKRLRIQPGDRILWSWLSRHWIRWREILAFVQPATVLTWQRRRFREHWARISGHGPSGRPAVSEEIRELIRKISSANPGWGSPRIVGELGKLGIEVAKSTVEKYRVRSSKPLSPTWPAFLKKPRRGTRVDRLLYRAHGELQSAVCAGRSCTSSPEARVFQCDGESDGPVGRPADRRSLSVG